MGRGLIFHLSALLIVLASLAGCMGKEKTVMSVYGNEPSMRSGFPYALTLLDFTVDTYDSGAVRDYVSRISVQGLDGFYSERTVSVNRPVKLGFWRIYQMGYQEGPDGRPVSVLECVKDPMWTLISIGLWILMAGSLVYAFRSIPRLRFHGLWTAVLVLFILFLYYTLERVGVGSHDLRPALRSGWFIPHIVAYMLAYAVLSGLMVTVALLWIRSLSRPVTMAERALLDSMVRVGWALLGAGMAMGALWAKQSWGDWWTWDIKEDWALLTWTGYMAYLHLRTRLRPRYACLILTVSFLALQMTWWGVSLWPSTGSLHVY